MRGEEESGVSSGGGQNGKHFLFFLFLFSPALFPLALGQNPELLKKPRWFSRPFPGVVCNNASSVTMQSLCTLRPSLFCCRPRPATSFLDSYSITNQHSHRGERGGGKYDFNCNGKLFYYSSSKDISIQFHESGEKEKRKTL